MGQGAHTSFRLTDPSTSDISVEFQYNIALFLSQQRMLYNVLMKKRLLWLADNILNFTENWAKKIYQMLKVKKVKKIIKKAGF